MAQSFARLNQMPRTNYEVGGSLHGPLRRYASSTIRSPALKADTTASSDRATASTSALLRQLPSRIQSNWPPYPGRFARKRKSSSLLTTTRCSLIAHRQTISSGADCR